MTKGTADSTGIKSLRRSSRIRSKSTDGLRTSKSKKTTELDNAYLHMASSKIKPPLSKIPSRASSQNVDILDALKALTTEVQSLRAHVDDIQAQQPQAAQQSAANASGSSPTSTVKYNRGEASPVHPAVDEPSGQPSTQLLHPSGGAQPVNPAANDPRGSLSVYPLLTSGGAHPVNPAANDPRGSLSVYPLLTSGGAHPVNPAVNDPRGSPSVYPLLTSGGANPVNPAVNDPRGSLSVYPLLTSGGAHPVNPAVNDPRGSPSVHPLPPSGEPYPVNPAVNDPRGLPSVHPLPPSGEAHPVNSAANDTRGPPAIHHFPPSGETYPINAADNNNVRGPPSVYPLSPPGEPCTVNPAVNAPKGSSFIHRSPTSGEFFSVNPAARTTRELSIRLPSPSEVNTGRHGDEELIESPRVHSFRTSGAIQPIPHSPTRSHGNGNSIPINHGNHRHHEQAINVVSRRPSVQDCITQAQTIGSLLPGKTLWCGSRDSSKRTFAESRQLVTTSMSYKWSPPCTQYFLTRQAYAPFIVQRLDLWEVKQDYGQLEELAQDPHSAYWKEATQRQWSHLSACFDKHNLDSLECRWRELKLTPDIHWDDYITRFEVVASQLAQARGVEALTQAEVRVHLYLSLPKALQSHCVQLGYNVGEKRMNYDGLVATCAGWCELNWQSSPPTSDTAAVNNVALSTSPSPALSTPQATATSSTTTTEGSQQKSDKKTRPTRPSTPYRQRVRDDAAILNNEYNVKILSSRCQRCLSESHDSIACCEDLTRKDERCYYCGLLHHHSLHCPAGHDNYRGRNCERCGKANHAARACRRFRPCAAPVAAAVSATPSSRSSPATDTPPLSFINLHINHSVNHIPALVDSGAAVSVVSSCAAASLNLTIIKADLRIRLADLSETTVRGVAKAVPISFSNGFHCTEDLYVLDGCAHRLILSVGLLRRLKAIWHLHDNYITFGDNQSGPPIPMMSVPKPFADPSRSPIHYSAVAELCNIMAPQTKVGEVTVASTNDDDTHPNTISLPADVWETLALSFFPEPREEDTGIIKGLTRSQTIDAFRVQFTSREDSPKPEDDLFDFSIDPPSETAPRGRLHCKVPWRDDSRPSPINNGAAIKRDFTVMARLNSAEASSYHQVVNDLYSLGFVVPARIDANANANDNPDHPSTTAYAQPTLPSVTTLIPAFPVFRECSKTSKTRLVLDCKYHNGFLRVGRQADDSTYPETLWGNLALSRTAPALVVDDISKAYHQIKLDDATDRRHFGMVACGRVGMWVSTCFGATYSPSALLQANRAVITLRDFESGHTSRDDVLSDPVCHSLISQFEENMKLWSMPLASKDSPITAKTSVTTCHDPLQRHTAIYVDDGQTRGKTKEIALRRANAFTGTQSGHGFHSNLPKRSTSWGPITDTKYLGYGWRTGDDCDEFSPTFRVPEAINLDDPPRASPVVNSSACAKDCMILSVWPRSSLSA